MKRKQAALITGATSGIGKELALLFAKAGYELVIVARTLQNLKKVAKELEKAGSPLVTTIPCDLSIACNAQKLYDQIKEKSIRVDVLVNDAGAGEYGLFKETSLEEELAIIQLNIASLVLLTKLYMKEMLKRNNGKILQLASIASYQPTPLLAVYAATKAFVLSFTDALINELKDSKVTMTALIPGATDTQFFTRAKAENIKATEHMEEPAVVANIGFEALMQGKPHAIAPGMKTRIIRSTLMSNQQVASMARKQMEEKDTSPKQKAKSGRLQH